MNNPLRYTDYSGYTWGIFKPFVKAGKWVWNVGLPAIDPMNAFVNFMDWINNSTPELRQEMANLGIPDFNVGGTVNRDGNVNVNGSIYGREVFNTANIDRSGPSVKATNKMLTNVRQDYGDAWHGRSGGIDAFSGADIPNWGGMYIISNVNSDAGLMDGHAWIRLESSKGESTTMSLWGNRGKQEFWINLEIDGGYGATKKFSPITPSQYNLIINYNSNPSNINWTPWNTCAGYSVGLWNYVNGDNLSATDYFWFTTPRRLAGSINTNP